METTAIFCTRNKAKTLCDQARMGSMPIRIAITTTALTKPHTGRQRGANRRSAQEGFLSAIVTNWFLNWAYATAEFVVLPSTGERLVSKSYVRVRSEEPPSELQSHSFLS